jgi:hypothetical protein
LPLKKKHFSVEQIIGVLKQAEVGIPVAEVIRKAWTSEQPVAVVVLDDLNERHTQDYWRPLVESSFDLPWAGRIRLICTARSQSWNEYVARYIAWVIHEIGFAFSCFNRPRINITIKMGMRVMARIEAEPIRLHGILRRFPLRGSGAMRTFPATHCSRSRGIPASLAQLLLCIHRAHF